MSTPDLETRVTSLEARVTSLERKSAIVPPSTIDATGAADVTAELLAFFASVPDGSTVLLPEMARYRVEGTLYFPDRNGITILGNGAEIFATTDGAAYPPDAWFKALWPRGRRCFYFVRGSDITIRDIFVHGANPNAGTTSGAWVSALAAQHAFEFAGTAGVLLENSRATDMYADFVYLGPAENPANRDEVIWTSDATIRNNHFERNGRQGISITGARDVLIENNLIGQVRHTGFDIEPNDANGGAINVMVRNNTFTNSRLLWFASVGHGGTVEDITLDGNILDGEPMQVVVTAPAGTRRSRFRITNNMNNTAFGAGSPLMTFTRVDDLVISGNVSHLNPDRAMTAVRLTDCTDYTVENNDFTGAAQILEILP